MASFKVTATTNDPQGNRVERTTASFSDFGDANRWAMGYLRGRQVGHEAWVIASTGQIVASYIVAPSGAPRVSARAERMEAEKALRQMQADSVSGRDDPKATH